VKNEDYALRWAKAEGAADSATIYALSTAAGSNLPYQDQRLLAVLLPPLQPLHHRHSQPAAGSSGAIPPDPEIVKTDWQALLNI